MTPPCDATAALPCWLEVDLDAVAANVTALRGWVGPHTRLAAVVKAQGYGTGAAEIARVALASGASWLAVARVHEGVELRAVGIDAPILVLTRTDPAEADLAVATDLTITVDCLELGRALGAAAEVRGKRAAVHVKVDTGLHRFGVEPDRALPLARGLADVSGLEVQALYTHFANADEPDQSYTWEQFHGFQRIARELAAAGYVFPMQHAANSAATLGIRDTHLDLVRVGLTLYGYSPSGATPSELALRPAVALRARIARVTTLAAGEGVGYGQTWRAQQPTRVALVTAGYADGVSRHLSNHGQALVGGQLVPIIGRVSMDLTTLDITRVPQASVGDAATFFGGDGAATLRLARYADAAGTIPHEALTSIGGRVARVYRRNNRVDKVARLNGAGKVIIP